MSRVLPVAIAVAALLSLNAPLSAAPGSGVFEFRVIEDSLAIDSLIVRISRAFDHVSYSGVRVREFTSKGERKELIWQEHHWGAGRWMVKFLSPSNVSTSLIVCDGEQRRTLRNLTEKSDRKGYHGGYRQVQKTAELFKEIKLLQQNYRVTATAGLEFLSRATILIQVSPRYPDRPALEVLVDAETKLLLQSTRLPGGVENDKLAEITRFTELTYGAPDQTLFEDAWSRSKETKGKRKSKHYADIEELKRGRSGEILVPEFVPSGFSLLRARVIERTNVSILHFLYGDGLSVISLFQHEGEHVSPKDKKRDRSGHQRFAMFRGFKSNTSYSIAGEISHEELQRMADHLRPTVGYKTTWNPPLIVGLALLIFVALASYFIKTREKVNV